MASLSEHPAAPDSGHQEIGALAYAWAAMAIRDTLDPDEGDLLQKYLRLLSQ
jgi:hypothetical protein